MSNEVYNKNKNTPDPGVFITKGMRLTIPRFSIRLGANGDVEGDPVILHTGIDLCPYWLEISYGHMLETQKANDDLMIAKASEDKEQISHALQAEFTAGMQTIMASAVAIDAFYGNIKEHIDIPIELTETWRKNGTARYKQIAEVWRRSFSISQESAQKIRDILKEVTSFRDKAVHPPPGTSTPLLHPELNKVTDWRYSTFRYYNAKGIAGITLSIIAQSIQKTHEDKFKELKTYCDNLLKEVGPMVDRWEKRYGKLFG